MLIPFLSTESEELHNELLKDFYVNASSKLWNLFPKPRLDPVVFARQIYAEIIWINWILIQKVLRALGVKRGGRAESGLKLFKSFGAIF